MYRNNYSNQKPEYALKRVNDLIASAIGNNADKEKKFALEQLHLIVSSAKKKQWQKVYEPIMKKHLELCVELKDHRTAKDGLHQYRNMCLNVDPSSLENVIVHLISLAEARATQAREKANKVALAAAAKISDLDQEETPESIMLSTMTEEGAKDRTDRAVVVPWLKFLWETYRAVLELLHKNAKLEKVYHKTCEKAFKFCLDYQRALEFRRLCEMLRQHFSNLQQMIAQPKSNRVLWEWTPEAIELHLQTRFSQLEVATSLELWNEGFRTVEDIYAVMQLGKKAPKPRLMMAYYEKLTRIFWVSENYLFHAYTSFRHYSLSCECRKDLKAEERLIQASNTILAALCIPTLKDSNASVAAPLDVTSLVAVGTEDEMALEKNQQMAMLLDFQANPTRQALLSDIMTKGMLNDTLAELSTLYHLLETKFSPLTLVKDVTPILQNIKNHPHLSLYSLPLQRVVVLRLIQQLSRIYTSVKIDFLKNLLVGLDLSFCDIERIVIDGVTRKQISLRFDNSNGCVRFGPAVAMASALESKLSNLNNQLNTVANVLENKIYASKKNENVLQRRDYFGKIASELDEHFNFAIERKMIIERRKEGLERLQQERQKEEGKRKEVEETRRKEDEQARLQKEEAQRKEAKMKKYMDLLDLEKTKKAMAALGKAIDDTTLEELDEASRRQLLLEAQTAANRAKEEEQRRFHDQVRRLDHITRAIRIETAPLYEKKYNEQKEKDFAEYLSQLEAKEKGDREEHAKALIEKARLAKMQGSRTEFENELLAEQRAAYEKRVAQLRQDAIREHKQRKIAKARRKKIEHDERMEELEQERLEKEAAARQLAEEVLRARRAQELEAEAEALKQAQREKEQKEKEAAQEVARQKSQEEADVSEGTWRRQETSKGRARRSFDDRVESSPSEPEPRRTGFGRETERRPEVDAEPPAESWRRSSGPPPPPAKDVENVPEDKEPSIWRRGGPSAGPASSAPPRREFPDRSEPRPSFGSSRGPEDLDKWSRRSSGPTRDAAPVERESTWRAGDGGDKRRDPGRSSDATPVEKEIKWRDGGDKRRESARSSAPPDDSNWRKK